MGFNKDFEPQKTDASMYIMNTLESGGKVKFRVLSDYVDGLSVWGDNEDGTRMITRVKCYVKRVIRVLLNRKCECQCECC